MNLATEKPRVLATRILQGYLEIDEIPQTKRGATEKALKHLIKEKKAAEKKAAKEAARQKVQAESKKAARRAAAEKVREATVASTK